MSEKVSLIETKYPGLDRYLYVAEEAHEWIVLNGLGGARDVTLRKSHPGGRRGYWKCDAFHFEGFAEKVCSDLAQILGLPVPAACLTRFDGKVQVISLEPIGSIQTLALVRGDRKFGPDDPLRLKDYVDVFDQGLIAFNLWVDSWDVHEGNFVCNVVTGMLWAIDYGNAFGHISLKDGQTQEVKYSECLWLSGDPMDGPSLPREGRSDDPLLPLPSFMHQSQIDLNQMKLTASEIQRIPDDVVWELVNRAASVYNSPNLSEFAAVVGNALISRKDKVSEWVNQRTA